MNYAGWLCVLAGMAGIAVAGGLQEERMWKGTNGNSFRGTFHQLAASGTKAEFVTASGKTVSVALENLIQEDRDLILNATGKAGAKAPAAPSFKPDPQPDRTLMPTLDPKMFNGSTEEAMVDALWVSLLWWNQTGVLQVPKDKDFEKKAEWLHKELTRTIATVGRSAASLEEGQKGVIEYFKNELKDLAVCRTYVETSDLGVARLSRLAQGSNVVILKMTMTYDNGRDFSRCMALESIDDSGKFVVHVFGKRFTGQVKPKEKKKGDPSKIIPLEFVLDQRENLPEYYLRNGAVFSLGGNFWNGALVLKPYVFATPGKPSPLPAGNEFAPDPNAKAAVMAN